MNTINIKKWIRALRSDRYHQVKGSLYRAGEYCVMGVAIRVASLNGFPIKENIVGFIDAQGQEILSRAPNNVLEWFGIDEDLQTKFIELNDRRQKDFKQFADTLECLLGEERKQKRRKAACEKVHFKQ